MAGSLEYREDLYPIYGSFHGRAGIERNDRPGNPEKGGVGETARAAIRGRGLIEPL